MTEHTVRIEEEAYQKLRNFCEKKGVRQIFAVSRAVQEYIEAGDDSE